MVGAGRLVYHSPLQIVESIPVILKIADNKAIQQPHHALDQKLHGGVVRRHLHPPRRFCLGLGNVPQEDHRIFGIFYLTAHDDIADPPLLAIQHDAAFLAQLGVQSLQFFCNVGAVIEIRHGLFVLCNDIVVHKEPDQLIPCMALLKGRHQGGFHLEGVKCVFFKVHIVFAEVCAGERAVKGGCPLRLHPASFFCVNVAEDSGDPLGRAIQTAYHLRRRPEPQVSATLCLQSVLHLILCLIGFVCNRVLQQLQDTVLILRMQKLRPCSQLVREIQNITIAKDAPKRMAPTHIDDLTVFIAVKIPERRVCGFIDQSEILIRPVDLHGHDPDRLSGGIRCIFFVEAHIDGGAVRCEDLPFSRTMNLTKAVFLKESDILPVKKLFQRALCLRHKGFVAVPQMVQQQITDRQNRQIRVKVPGNGPDTAVFLNRFLHRLKHTVSQLCHVRRIDSVFIAVFVTHFRPSAPYPKRNCRLIPHRRAVNLCNIARYSISFFQVLEK